MRTMRLFPVLSISCIYFVSSIILSEAQEVGIVCLTFTEEETRPQERSSNFLKVALAFMSQALPDFTFTLFQLLQILFLQILIQPEE